MIDVHCHLEQKDYDKDRDDVIERCKNELKAVVTSCAHPKDLGLTLELVEKHKGFVFATLGIHPEYIKEISEKEKGEFLNAIAENRERIAAIGETGLDFWYIKEEEWQEKQKQLFVQLINLAKALDKPLVIHSRGVFEETLEILESQSAEKVLLHMWGEHKLLERVLENGYHISMNTIILRSKGYRKVVRDCPLDRLMLETDSPWLAPKKLMENVEARNDPLSVKVVAEKIAEIKKVSFEEVWQKCGENAVNFFSLPIKL